MISIQLSEKDFDYELQALVRSFFPGRQCFVTVPGQEEDHNEIFFFINIVFGNQEILVEVKSQGEWYSQTRAVTGEDDWHKKEGKVTHPYRTYYKNVLKKLLFEMLRDFPCEELLGGIERRVPEWGTMTGVRPTKIAMSEILAGKSQEEVQGELEQTYCCSPEKVQLGMEIARKEAKLLESISYENGYSLYIGIPFCPTTCLYCSFPSYPLEQFKHLTQDYVEALKVEIAQMSQVMQDRNLCTVYFGGGTPTALSAEQLKELITHVKKHFAISDACEFTVEAGRPDSITREKLVALSECGVDRISVNPQTMQDKTLELIGRRHTVQETKEAFLLARELGFSNINMDLIIGLPGETEEDFADTLKQVAELNPDSVTIHSLVIKRASRLRSVLEEFGPLEETEQVRAARMEKMLVMGQEFARSHGYEPYYMYRQKNSAGHAGSSGQENIGYARSGKECIYNILIMEEKQTILALGAGGSTKLYHPKLGQVSRIENVKSVTDYINRVEEMIERKYESLIINGKE